MSAPQKTIFDYDAELINLRMMAIFLFLLSTSLGVTFGSIVGVSSFEHHHRIPMALFIAISTSLAILLSLIALLRWWYYSGERFPPKYELYIHNYPIGMVRGSTEWRKFMLGYDSSMSFNRKIGIWITWLVYHLVRVADKIFGHGLPPSSYVEAARVEEGGVEMEVEVLGGSRSRRMALRGDEKGESFNSATSVENGHRYSEDPARPSMTYDESYGLEPLLHKEMDHISNRPPTRTTEHRNMRQFLLAVFRRPLKHRDLTNMAITAGNRKESNKSDDSRELLSVEALCPREAARM
ncbi:hypothetical protein CkaCkLH20_07163 [Colletotrichum karsti]|uniref:Uncharacterized protein n=1 Tax=Colletotrichum karsti TaxID=1095194 RepID=A0A9P6I2N6_9PEZI|nr:uncharacterized protein CkaCkLH20_07163 [Colletotrichum karsti]KAF9875343.1 hypothetical protein CkaCkLH20_07163 [Colletotrichum karsti]